MEKKHQCKIDGFDKALEEDFQYFENQIKKGVKRLAGDETVEDERLCFHCKLWRRANKFIKEMRELE